MKDLVIQATKNTPSVHFQTIGDLSIRGKILSDNAVTFFSPMINWIEQLQAEHVVFDIVLEYINTSATMQLFSILKMLDENEDILSISVNWIYEEDDEDHLETGEFFEDKLERVEFTYTETSESIAA